jgi:hypothetical protein
MTIHLAVDNTNIEEFPGVNLGDVRLAMEAVAKRIEEGEWGAVTNGILILETEEGIEQFHWGKLSTAIEAIGLLCLARARLELSMISGVEE